ncbi:transcriptional regulator [Candidatus Saganbacteria bacterium]|nr:transcriptional regulator [Candidatus Saganbacteria bacterium]
MKELIANYDFGEYADLVAATLQAPKGVVCLLSSLAFHEATREIPGYVYLAIPRGTRANKIKYPPVKFYHFAQNTWEAGIEEHKVERQKIRIYNLAKTIADCFKFRNQLGLDIAREALKIAIKEKHVQPKEIMYYAKICRVDNIIKPRLEAML